MEYTIILFYKYISIEDPGALREAQFDLCKNLKLKGRVIVSEEGINATLEGTDKNIEKYIKELTSDKRFADIHFKKSGGTGDAFPRLSVKVRPEIVSLHLGDEDLNPNEKTGKYLKPEDLHKWFERGEEFEIVDMRNDYEYKSGHFRGSRLLPIKNFREVPEVLPKIEDIKDKKVLAVCTGGVRCEKATGYLKEKGFENIYQLEGGIVSYMEKYPNKNFLGKLYVFDGRVTMGFETDSPEHVVVGKCEKCASKTDKYADCKRSRCGTHFICCMDCRDENGLAYCSEDCQKAVV
ncbi:MAG: rhodanese-related sulfurtransferase [Candidatus Spechtbacterales bacterium]|nr:rhodanese-related sulfurtransferase [Candidatus Spechtbacterales bacterium]